MLILDALVDSEQRKTFVDAVHNSHAATRAQRAQIAAAAGGQVVKG